MWLKKRRALQRTLSHPLIHSTYSTVEQIGERLVCSGHLKWGGSQILADFERCILYSIIDIQYSTVLYDTEEGTPHTGNHDWCDSPQILSCTVQYLIKMTKQQELLCWSISIRGDKCFVIFNANLYKFRCLLFIQKMYVPLNQCTDPFPSYVLHSNCKIDGVKSSTSRRQVTHDSFLERHHKTVDHEIA